MNPSIRAGRALLAALLLSIGIAPAPASAQVYVVDQDGSGDFSGVQAALDTVAPGSTLIVHGTWQGQFLVNKSVTIVGLRMNQSKGIGGPDLALIEVDAGPGSHVNFVHLDLELRPEYTSAGVRGINVWSAGDVVITDSTIRCNTVLATACETYQRDGEPLAIYGADFVSVVRSSLTAGGGYHLASGMKYLCEYYKPDMRPRGGHALTVEGPLGMLLVQDSLFVGGDGCALEFDCSFDGVPPGYAPIGGDGGNAISYGGTTFLSNCALVPGKGARGYTTACDPPLEGWGGDGSALAGPGVELGDALVASEAVLGRRLVVAGQGFAPDRAALLFFSTELMSPVAIRQGLWFLACPFAYLGAVPTDAAGAFVVSGELPTDPALAGIKFMLQAADATRLSEPAVIVVRPPL